ncbi:MAG: hypothetical protein IPO27_12920 [Bacteroidetes bacterium]|nr:hypothetical protein [Bacteroidota bacterium]
MSIKKKKVQQKIADYLFRKELQKQHRHPRSVSFDRALKIGILYDATYEEDYEVIKKYVKSMRDLQKDVLALGYIDQKEMPNMRFSKLGLDFFTFKNLTWLLKPNHPMVDKFTQVHFDILINLNIHHCFPLKYLASITKANFKIGRYEGRHHQYCDFMIKTNDKVTLAAFIELVDKYLKHIGNAHVRTA